MAWNDNPQPTLRTARLILRPFVAGDADRLHLLVNDRAIADTTASIPHPYPAGLAATWIVSHAIGWAAGNSLTWGVTTPEDGVVGVMGLVVQTDSLSGTLGYWIGVPFWGRGIATEAATAVRDFAFEVIGLNRFDATYLVRNPASGRVMEKLGMQPEGVFRQAIRKWDVFEDVAQKAILRSEWEALRR